MVKRSYNQYCAVAHALDIVGERWTLLIVRELLIGPKRFTDLLNNLPGLGTNLLAARLRELEENRIVERETLPPPAASQVYALTELGQALDPVITELWKWGAKTQEARREQDRFRPGWTVFAMKYVFSPEKAHGLHETYEYHIGDEVFHARIDDGTIETRQGAAERPDLVITTDHDTCFDLASRRITLLDAIDKGLVQAQGGLEIIRRCCEVLGLPTSQEELIIG